MRFYNLFLNLNVAFALFFAALGQMKSLEFEKDDDSNGHIDFITAASVSTFDHISQHFRAFEK